MRTWSAAALCALLAGSGVGCSVNILETFANKNTDEAFAEDAKTMINEGQYDAALEKIALMSTSYQDRREVKMLKASAYGGKCGMPLFLTFVQQIAGMGTARLFPFLTGQFVGGTPARIDACREAEDIIESIGTITQRTANENMLLVLISFAKIGNVLSLYADQNQNGTPDTAADNGGSAFNPCLETPRAARPASPVNGDWFNTDLRELGSGITLALSNIAAVSDVVDLGTSSFASITDACNDLGTLNPDYNFCSVTDPDSFSADQLKGIKSILKEDTVVGLGTNCSGDISTCFCP